MLPEPILGADPPQGALPLHSRWLSAIGNFDATLSVSPNNAQWGNATVKLELDTVQSLPRVINKLVEMAFLNSAQNLYSATVPLVAVKN